MDEVDLAKETLALFARLVVRVRREVSTAKSQARQALRAARELGSYRLVRCLGKGGMGEVWLAEHRMLARQAAIKIIRADAGDTTAEARKRFQREAQTLASLRARNTIALFDYGVAEDGTYFFVMELLDGLDLERLVERHGPQSADRVIRILVQVCRSLAEAHDAGLVHRDIKPANVFLCRAASELDVVKVLDFGLVHRSANTLAAISPAALVDAPASGAASLTAAGAILGTPECIAPEQALGEEVDGRADIYAVGCVAYWLLVGQPVFRKDTVMQTIMAHVSEPPMPLRERVPQVPVALEQLLLGCLAKDRNDRPQTMHDLLVALESIERSLAPEMRWTEERAEIWWRENVPPAGYAEAEGEEAGGYLHVGMQDFARVAANHALESREAREPDGD